MRILFTGGAGYLGTQLVPNLSCLKETSEIVVFDNSSRGNFNLFIGDQKLGCPVQLVESDILDSRRFQQALQNIDIAYHLAAKVTPPFQTKMPTCLNRLIIGVLQKRYTPSKKARFQNSCS